MSDLTVLVLSQGGLVYGYHSRGEFEVGAWTQFDRAEGRTE